MTGSRTEGASGSGVDPDTGGIRTPLFELHNELGGRMVSFGGHALPMRYGDGTVAEHRRSRTAAGLFDVSHMGIIDLRPPDGMSVAEAARWLEGSVPGSIVNLKPGRMRYTQFTTPSGGVLDDLIVSNLGDRLRLVVNAVRTEADLAALEARLHERPEHDAGQVTRQEASERHRTAARADAAAASAGDDSDANAHVGTSAGSPPAAISIEPQRELALLALQGPAAREVLGHHAPDAADLAFMATMPIEIQGVPCEVSRCGYTGEDGFEITVPGTEAAGLARMLLADTRVAPAGLGARDTLRLEAGLPLVGHELTEATTPAEAGLGWSIPKRRRIYGGFPGAAVIAAQLADGPPRRRVGIAAVGRRPIRDGAALRAPGAAPTDAPAGIVTSGGFGPTVDAPVAMAYVAAEHAADGTELLAEGRKGAELCRVAPLPFVEHRFWRGP